MDMFKVLFLMLSIGLSSTTHVFAYDNCSVDSKKCSLAIFPHSNFKQILITYKSILEDLALILDTRVKLVSSRTMSEFGYKLDNKLYDLALIGSGQYISHAQPAGYVPLVSRVGVLGMRLFVKSESSIKSYNDLKGKRLGMMVLNTTTWFSGNILLQKNGLKKEDVELVSLGSQQACAHAIAIKQVDACFFSVSNLEIIKEQNVNVNFRAIGTPLDIPIPVYAVHPDMPKELVEEIKSYLLSREGYIAVNDADFNHLRELVSLIK